MKEFQAPAEGDEMLEPLIYAAIMHSGRPKTIGDFEQAAANVADMLKRREASKPQPKGLTSVCHIECDGCLDAGKCAFPGKPAEPVRYPHPDEDDAVTLWAEIHRLRAAVQGPDGYATWQEAATAERVRRVAAEKALAAAQAPAPAPEEPSIWAQYVAGMVVAYLGGGVDDERTKPIASIIERRLWALAPSTQAPAVGAEPIGYLNPKVLGPDGKIAATGALTHSGVPVGGWTLPIYTAPQPKAAQAALTDEQRLGREARLRAAGMSGLLSEILGKGALSQYGDADLIERVEMAVADQEAASKPSVQGSGQ